jgi:hypothetical protein
VTDRRCARVTSRNVDRPARGQRIGTENEHRLIGVRAIELMLVLTEFRPVVGFDSEGVPVADQEVMKDVDMEVESGRCQ